MFEKSYNNIKYLCNVIDYINNNNISYSIVVTKL